MDEVRTKYAGSVVGLFWVVLSPLILLTLYSVVYLVIFRVQPASMTQHGYVLYILSGLVPFLGFADALHTGSSSLSSNKAILLNTVYPAELVPLRAVLASHAMTLVGLGIVVLATLFLGSYSWALVLLPVLLLFQVMLAVGIAWVFSLASLVLRDISHILGFATMLLLIMSPIAYTPDMVPNNLQFIIYLNPLSYFITGFQEILAYGRPPSWSLFSAITCLGLMSFCVGYWVFSRMKKAFFDYV
ncbi:MAG: ABC transporter permease [Nitrospira sp.]|jgi:lipopolysaccharide transport system permease protein|nr:ABC transporter permease [Nitrospira sp. BO4]